MSPRLATASSALAPGIRGLGWSCPRLRRSGPTGRRPTPLAPQAHALEEATSQLGQPTEVPLKDVHGPVQVEEQALREKPRAVRTQSMLPSAQA